MSDTEYLTQVDETHRSDGEYFISDAMNSNWLFARKDEALMIPFDEVSAFLEEGSEWATFYFDGESTSSICNERNTMFPHWLFEEFHYLEANGELRPADQYETEYRIKTSAEMVNQ